MVALYAPTEVKAIRFLFTTPSSPSGEMGAANGRQRLLVSDIESRDLRRRSRRESRALLILIAVLGGVVLLSMRRSGKIALEQCDRLDFDCHADAASAYFAQMQARQSQTIRQAIAEYRRRYKRKPPVGFEQWFLFAKEHNVTLIDEYDQIENDLAPFRASKLKKADYLARMDSALESERYQFNPPNTLGFMEIRNGSAHVSIAGNEKMPKFGRRIEDFIASFVHALPDLTILYSWMESSRCVPTHEDGTNSMLSEDLSWRSTWDTLRESCVRNVVGADSSQNARFKSYADSDVCTLPPASRFQHGFLNAPDNCRIFRKLVPLFNRGKLSTNGDIVVPPMCYYLNYYQQFEEVDDIPFDQKRLSIHWRGSMTGYKMMAKQKHWTEGHRQRFLIHANSISEQVKLAKAGTDEYSASRLSSAGVQKWLRALPDDAFDVASTRVMHCEQPVCEIATNALRQSEQQPASESFKHRIVADLDGESISCRFYRLLHSGSVTLKQTIYREWHSDRLIPWLHYVPLSLQMDELGPLTAWLLAPDNDERVRRIADGSRTWAQTSLRSVDAAAYYYRLLLEYGEIFNG